MIPKKYSSFEQIDHDLKILRLRREVDKESLKYVYQNAKNNLYPTSLLGGFSGIIKKLLISIVAKKVLNRFSN